MPMKRFCLFLLLWTGALLLVACSSDNAATGSDVPLDAEPLTARIGYTEALRLAGRGIEMLDSAPQTRATAGRRTIDAQRLRYMLRATTRAGADQDTLLYVFNFADSAGFALVAADRRSGGLLAVTESGNFTPGERTGNPGFDLYMSGVENYLDDLLNTPPLDLPSGEEPLLRREKSTHTESVGPLVTVAWGQHYPYNLYCFDPSGSSAPSGCVATAVAQILSAWSYPPDMHIFYPGADLSFQTLDWPAVNRHKKTYYCGADCTEHKTIARLLREIGWQVEMDYSIGGSSAYSNKVPGCLFHFGYTSSALRDYHPASICLNLDNHWPVYMRGTVEGTSNGHAWVVDGYRRYVTVFTVWATYPNGITRLFDEYEETNMYLHCNWGWDGSNNGYFTMNIFDTGDPYELDPGSSNTEDYNFVSIQIINDIRPRNLN